MATLPVFQKAFLQLLLGTAIWGLGFVAAAHTLRFADPLWSNAFRFLLTSVLAVLVFGRRFVLDRRNLEGAALAATALAGAFAFQTAGLKYTTVAHSSLITGLYCVFTPLMAPLFKAPAPNRIHVVGAVVAVLGLCVLGRAWEATADFNVGDVLTLGGALVAACHIHIVGRVSKGKDAFAFNALQMVFCGVFSTVLAVVLGPPMPRDFPAVAWLPYFYLAIFSSLVAFGFQMTAQQVLSPTTAATLLLMEAPFGVLAGAAFLDEKLGWSQLLGGALMLGGCLVSIRADTWRVVQAPTKNRVPP